MIHLNKDSLDNVKFNLLPAKKVGPGIYSSKIRVTNDEEQHELVIQTPICKINGGLINIDIDSKMTQLICPNNTLKEMLDTVVENVLQKIPDNVLRLVYNDENMTQDKRFNMLDTVYEHDELGNTILNVHCPVNSNGLNVSVYNHKQEEIDYTDLTEKQSKGDMLTILNVKELLFTTHSFKLIIFVNQILCLTEPEKKKFMFLQTDMKTDMKTDMTTDNQQVILTNNDVVTNDVVTNDISSVNNIVEDTNSNTNDEPIIEDVTITVDIPQDLDNENTENNINLVITDISNSEKEVSIPVDEEPIILRDRKKLYREMFEQFLKEAVEYQEKAVKSYLQAKKIKDEFFEDDEELDELLSDVDLEDFEDSEDDSDEDSQDDSEDDSDEDSDEDSD